MTVRQEPNVQLLSLHSKAVSPFNLAWQAPYLLTLMTPCMLYPFSERKRRVKELELAAEWRARKVNTLGRTITLQRALWT